MNEPSGHGEFAAEHPLAVDAALAHRWTQVTERIVEAARAADRSPDEITTIVVTKFHPASLVRQLVQLGARHVGESRHQEAAPKAAELASAPLTWHFVGQLQSNKARAVADYCAVIHSVDRVSLVDALERAEKPRDVFLELDLSGQPGRGGVQPADLESLAERVLATGFLRLKGLMAVAPLGAEPRAAFAHVRELSDRVRRLAPEATAISTGMSGDFAEAIAEGATHLRIGTAITGERPSPR